MYITKSARKETRDGAKLSFSKGCLNYRAVDFNHFLYINPTTPVLRCLDNSFSQFMETRLESQQYVHPLRETANKGKYLIFFCNGTIYLIERKEIKETFSKTWVEETGEVISDTYSYTSKVLDIDILIDE